MNDEFYCGCCGKFKKLEFLYQHPTATRPKCKSCHEILDRTVSKRSEASRDKKRARISKKGTVYYNPNV